MKYVLSLSLLYLLWNKKVQRLTFFARGSKLDSHTTPSYSQLACSTKMHQHSWEALSKSIDLLVGLFPCPTRHLSCIILLPTKIFNSYQVPDMHRRLFLYCVLQSPTIKLNCKPRICSAIKYKIP